MVSAISKELILRSPDIRGQLINTIYFGGGTPSLLGKENLLKITSTIRDQYEVPDNVDFTLEVNPEDVSENNVRFWKEVGVNRYSIGVQSFCDHELTWMNRKHTAKQSLDALSLLQSLDNKNISIDLIYGLPQTDLPAWSFNLEKAMCLDVPHISVYQLAIEPDTVLERKIKSGELFKPDDDMVVDQFNMLLDNMNEHGYEHYEISSFSKPGFRSKHNISYWTGKNYFGFGPSAHSYYKDRSGLECRGWNVSDNQSYLSSLSSNKLPFEKELLSVKEKFNEYIMTRLRTWQGCDLSYVIDCYGREIYDHILKEGEKHIENNKIHKLGNVWHLTRKGKLFSDQVIADLFIV
jgi:oxygen-independent coproporphyrinogen-3 oxidase